jgi:hypothetical protein
LFEFALFIDCLSVSPHYDNIPYLAIRATDS